MKVSRDPSHTYAHTMVGSWYWLLQSIPRTTWYRAHLTAQEFRLLGSNGTFCTLEKVESMYFGNLIPNQKTEDCLYFLLFTWLGLSLLLVELHNGSTNTSFDTWPHYLIVHWTGCWWWREKAWRTAMSLIQSSQPNLHKKTNKVLVSSLIYSLTRKRMC